MSSLSPPSPYRIAGSPPALVWGEPAVNSSATVRDLFNGDEHVRGSYWSDAGSALARIDIRLNGTPSDAIEVGHSIPDLGGSQYVIVEAIPHGSEAFKAVRVKAVRRGVYAAAAASLDRAADEHRSRRAAMSDPRLDRVKKLIKRAIEQTSSGWYSDVYFDSSDGELDVGGPCSTGFQTHRRQDGLCVIYRTIEGNDYEVLRDGRELHEQAVSAVQELRRYEAESVAA